MAIDRGPWNALVDDDGSNTVGSLWNKAAIKTVILDPADAAYPSISFGAFTPVDASGAGLTFQGGTVGTWVKQGRMVFVALQVVYPATANGAGAAIGGLPHVVSAPGAGGTHAYGTSRTWYLPGGGTQLQPLDLVSSGQQTNTQLSGANVIISAVYLTP